MNKTVAIVGTHPLTRDKAPWTDPSVDIWIFNNQLLQGWCPRANAVFDIHSNEDIYRRSLEHPAFGEWLKAEKNGLVFYTPYPMPEAPGNAVYPKDEIVKALLPHFKRGSKGEQEYFTSGPCYALALAIFLGYERIEMYGIEMESDSEYIYQRDGVALWHGIAIGRGIDVVLPENSLMYYAPLYGYESEATKVDFEAFETRATELQQVIEKTTADFHKSKGVLDGVNERINHAKQTGSSDEEMAKFGPEYMEAVNAYEQAIANHGFVNGQYMECRAWQTRIKKAMEYGGKAQEMQAVTASKWHRFQDKIEMSGGVGPQAVAAEAPK